MVRLLGLELLASNSNFFTDETTYEDSSEFCKLTERGWKAALLPDAHEKFAVGSEAADAPEVLIASG